MSVVGGIADGCASDETSGEAGAHDLAAKSGNDVSDITSIEKSSHREKYGTMSLRTVDGVVSVPAEFVDSHLPPGNVSDNVTEVAEWSDDLEC